MRKMEYNGKQVDVAVIEFETTKAEQFSVHKLTDGTIIKVRHTVNEIVRVIDEYATNGEPIYLLTNVNVQPLSTARPENLKHTTTKFDA